MGGTPRPMVFSLSLGHKRPTSKLNAVPLDGHHPLGWFAHLIVKIHICPASKTHTEAGQEGISPLPPHSLDLLTRKVLLVQGGRWGLHHPAEIRQTVQNCFPEVKVRLGGPLIEAGGRVRDNEAMKW